MPTSDGSGLGPNESDEPSDPSAVDLDRCDERALSYLDDVGAQYPALIAANCGLYDELLERRLVTMREAGLVERVGDERVFRITCAGRDTLDR